MNKINLSSLAAQEFSKYIFDHNLPKEKENVWYQDEKIEAFIAEDPTALIQNTQYICEHFNEIAQEYSLAQVNQGIWFLICGPLEFGTFLVNKSIDLQLRVSCIESMFLVYRDFVAPSPVNSMANCFDMWWDCLLSDFWLAANSKYIDHTPHLHEEAENFFQSDEFMGYLSFMMQHEISSHDELLPEDQIIHNALFETLKKILALDEIRTQCYALHGLGHLRHPHVKDLVQAFIDANKNQFEDDLLEWIEDCRDGDVM